MNSASQDRLFLDPFTFLEAGSDPKIARIKLPSGVFFFSFFSSKRRKNAIWQVKLSFETDYPEGVTSLTYSPLSYLLVLKTF